MGIPTPVRRHLYFETPWLSTDYKKSSWYKFQSKCKHFQNFTIMRMKCHSLWTAMFTQGAVSIYKCRLARIRDCHYKDRTVLRPSCIYHWNPSNREDGFYFKTISTCRCTDLARWPGCDRLVHHRLCTLWLQMGVHWGRYLRERKSMMTSSNGSIFRVTGPLCGEFTGHRWIPLTKASDAELWCFLWSTPE